MEYDIRHRSIASLDLLMVSAASDPPRWWRDEELAGILRHQLDAPLVFDLREARGSESTPAKDGSTAAMPGTFSDLLFAPNPPLPLLWLMKEFAKTSDTRLNSPLPPGVATVLYYGAILAARLRHGERISGLSHSELKAGLSWVLAQKWIDEQTQALFQSGLDSLIELG